MRISVKDFQGLRIIEPIEIKKFTILIGEQATGKSVIAKLLYFFTDVLSYDGSSSLEEYLEEKKNVFAEIFPKNAWRNQTFEIEYFQQEWSIQLKVERAGVNLNPSPDLLEILKGIESRYAEQDKLIKASWSALSAFQLPPKFFDTLGNAYKSLEKIPYSEKSAKFKKRFLDDFAKGLEIVDVLDKKFPRKAQFYEPLFIPAARAFFSILDKGAYEIFRKGSQGSSLLDPILLQFGTFYRADIGPFLLSDVAERILKAKLVQEGEKNRLVSFDDPSQKIDLEYASSGQQEVFPLLVSLARLSHSIRRFVLIEEPEAHIFPSSQVELTNLIFDTFKVNETSKVLLTTHSPYILTAINNLLMRNQASKRDGLDIKELEVYALENGGARSLIDKETGLVDGEYIDQVSEKLSDEFMDLVDRVES